MPFGKLNICPEFKNTNDPEERIFMELCAILKDKKYNFYDMIIVLISGLSIKDLDTFQGSVNDTILEFRCIKEVMEEYSHELTKKGK